ncbi:woronin body major [Trichoderma arundinaceum]|uniref:Woronin body major n=1 Tax=Trichoderma arundinaceum TaxID=490622 RepID=A0A395NAB1_TRIAR|nr:woronin body major [Trichoderma arundinaceum]
MPFYPGSGGLGPPVLAQRPRKLKHKREISPTNSSTFRPIPPPPRDYTETQVKVDSSRRFSSPIDVAEREYRERFRPQQPPQSSTGLELVPVRRPRHQSEKASKVNEFTVDERTTIARPNFREEIKITEEIREHTPYPSEQSAKMGYYDEEGSYHSIRQGVAKAVDKLLPHHHHHHHQPHNNGNNNTTITEHIDIVDVRNDANPSRRPAPAATESHSQPNTVSIPCHHIRLGDFLMLQGRPCQVIRISTSSATGQYRYLGVDLFTKQLHEESSFIANPAPSVVVQTMLGPVFKQYRVLDMSDGYVTAMTETGDVKQGLSVIDQSNLWSRLQQAFESGRGSVRVLVLNDGGRELAVEMKVIHGSRL